MKRVVKSLILILCVVGIFVTSKITTSAKDNKKILNEGKIEEVIDTKDNEDEEFTFRLYVDKLDMYTYSKGHNGKYTIEYSVNGGDTYKSDMRLDVVSWLAKQPLYVSHYVDVENVNVGDVIYYEYTYYNTYLFPEEAEPSISKGNRVVDKK